LVPQRSRSMHPECTSPRTTFLQHMTDVDEFVPPIPPPPYYPPEYTCSSETDAQSITYNGSMESPGPLYPTDFPPPYEAIIGNSITSQITDIDQQLTEISNSSFCEHILSTAFSGEGSMDSGSLMMSEIIDIADDSSCSEDSCLMGVQGSVHHIRSSSVQRAAATCGSSLEGDQCQGNSRSCGRSGRSYSCSTSSRYFAQQLAGEDILTQSCQRLEAAGSCSQTQTDWLTRQRNCSVSSDTSAFQTVLDNLSQGCHQPCPSRRYTPCSEACLLPNSQHGTPELLRRMPVGKLRPVMRGKALQTLSKEGTRSLGDLKMCRGTRVLMARFLQRSKRNLTMESSHSPSGAMGSKRRMDRGTAGGGFEQVSRSRWQCSVRQRHRRQEGIHLRSCGDLSSSTFSLRRLFSSGRLESSRPHSLIGVYRETIL
ncbi:protein ENTREP3, partial [Heterodontus francisci]|uniref:protein ENTREP3 n=1 Tax=Heterodontus francisci TaxID=7792 RepID=UPI00355BB7C0